MPPVFKPDEKEKPYKVMLPLSLVQDLVLIARIRTEVNKKVGSGREFSVTRLLLEAAQDLRDAQFKEWGKPENAKAERELVERLAAVHDGSER